MAMHHFFVLSLAAAVGWYALPSLQPVHSNTSLVEPTVIDFCHDPSPAWRPLNDGVMGGLSEGTIEWLPSGMRWTGQTRLENNGGFSSIRGPWEVQNLSAMQRIVIRCRGNGGPFKLTLEMSERWWIPYAYSEFDVQPSWTDVVIERSELGWSQAFTGDMNMGTVDAALRSVLRLGLMKYDGTAQAFDLEIASIRIE